MKHINTILLALLLMGPALCGAQTLSRRGMSSLPVKSQAWASMNGRDSLTLYFDLTISDGWHVYSTDQTGGPTSAAIHIDSISGMSLSPQLEFQGTRLTHMDDMFGCQVSYFEKSVRFFEKAAITAPDWYIEGNLTYGACNDVSCLPPSHIEFLYTPALLTGSQSAATTVAGRTDSTPVKTDLSALPDYDPATWQPVEYPDGALASTGRGLIGLLLTSMLGGLLALLTPCVWPIIPMTVSFFLKRAGGRSQAMRDAVIYGLCIMAVYVSLGLTVTVIFGANALNALATGAVVNVIFFLVLVLFALSFFGLFELTLPGAWSTGADKRAGRAGKSGLGGLFFMALTLAIVSFSCTGPIIGFLLVDAAQNGSLLAPIVGMTGFSLALAIPFSLFAMFPHWLESMPKSGAWMKKVKVTLGMVELAFSLKFLSVADMAYGWGILPRELFIALWVLMAMILGLYLCGAFQLFKGGKDRAKGGKRANGPVSIAVGCLSLAFAAWMVTGLWGAPLKAVSAFCPPMSTGILGHDGYTGHVEARYTDYSQALEASAQTGKPVLIDFTGYGCVNCRKMEAAVWTDPAVAREITDNFILVSLYVDDRSPLQGTVIVTENGQNVKLRTVGDKWSLLQRFKFGASAQPFYVITGADGSLKSQPYTFDQDPAKFLGWLSNANGSSL